jgi:hypothetical protein
MKGRSDGDRESVQKLLIYLTRKSEYSVVGYRSKLLCFSYYLLFKVAHPCSAALTQRDSPGADPVRNVTTRRITPQSKYCKFDAFI